MNFAELLGQHVASDDQRKLIELAESLQKPFAEVNNWLHGRSTPSCKEARKLAKYLNLIGYDESNQPIWHKDCDSLLLSSGCNEFAVLLNKYLHNNQIKAAQLTNELTRMLGKKVKIQPRMISAWRNGIHRPGNVEKASICASCLGLTGEEYDKFVTVAGYKPSPSHSHRFLQELFNHLRNDPPHIRLLLLTEDLFQPFILEMLKEYAELLYYPLVAKKSLQRFFHIAVPCSHTIDKKNFFQEIAAQCGFEEVDNSIKFRKTLCDYLKQYPTESREIFVLITGFEKGNPNYIREFAQVLQTVVENEFNNNPLNIIIVGGEKLYNNKYLFDNYPLLNLARLSQWPQFNSAEVYALRDKYYRNLHLNDELVNQFIRLSCGHFKLLMQCMALKKQYHTQLNSDHDYQQTDAWHQNLQEIFMPLIHAFGQKKLLSYLTKKNLGEKKLLFYDPLLSRLYWKNLIVEKKIAEQDSQLSWRCEELREAAMKLLKTTSFPDLRISL